MKPRILFEITRRVTDSGVYGTLWHHGDPFAVTLERAEEDGNSKIPDGLWYCDRRRYIKGGYHTFEIHVPHHDLILFHKGNWQRDTEGCVLIAEQFHDFNPAPGLQDPGIGNSAGGFAEFMALANDSPQFFTKFSTMEAPTCSPYHLG